VTRKADEQGERFDPTKHWVDLSKKKDGTQLYLEVRWLKMWFNEE